MLRELLELQNEQKKSISYHHTKFSTRQVCQPRTRTHSQKTKQSKQKRSKLWGISATTLTRGNSPSFLISKSQRFTTAEQDENKHKKFICVNLRKPLDKGVSFSKSKRKNHFVHKDREIYPSSASYFNHDNIISKNSAAFQNLDPEAKEKFQLLAKQLNQDKRKYWNGGFKFKKFQKEEVLFLHHGRNIPYHPQFGKATPGVGQYIVGEKSKSPAYTMRLVLKRFNQKDNTHPGPGSYDDVQLRPHTSSSINWKGTFHQSKRTFLTKSENGNPGPGSYQKK